METLVSKLSFM